MFISILKKPCINNERAGKSPSSFSCIDNKVVSVADNTKQNRKKKIIPSVEETLGEILEISLIFIFLEGFSWIDVLWKDTCSCHATFMLWWIWRQLGKFQLLRCYWEWQLSFEKKIQSTPPCNFFFQGCCFFYKKKCLLSQFFNISSYKSLKFYVFRIQ